MTDQTLFTIQRLHTADHLKQLQELHSLIFNETPLNQPSLNTLVGYLHSGQHLLGVFSEEQMFAYLIAYYGRYNRDPKRPAMANLLLALDQIAVHPDYRSIGLGTRLMLELREIAVNQAVRLIKTAFSPLNSRAAYLFIRQLGAMVNQYVPDYFPSGLDEHISLESQGQLLAEWWVNHNRVEQRLFGRRSPLSLKQYQELVPIINPSTPGPHDLPLIANELHEIGGETMLLVEIPSDYSAIMQRDPALAIEWRDHTQQLMQKTFAMGYVATDFLYDWHEDRLRSFYLMSWDGPQLAIDIDEGN